MTQRTIGVFLLIAGLMLPVALQAGRGDRDRDSGRAPWIHVEVLEDDGDGAKVSVNLPLSLAEIALEMIESESDLIEGHLDFEHGDISLSDIRKMWRELRDAGDAEFVKIEDGDETVLVHRKGDRVLVEVDGDDEQVRVQLPVALVDALLGGDDDSLDIEAAMAELENLDRGDIIRVEDGSDLVRVWID